VCASSRWFQKTATSLSTSRPICCHAVFLQAPSYELRRFYAILGSCAQVVAPTARKSPCGGFYMCHRTAEMSGMPVRFEQTVVQKHCAHANTRSRIIMSVIFLHCYLVLAFQGVRCFKVKTRYCKPSCPFTLIDRCVVSQISTSVCLCGCARVRPLLHLH
jgi:hypothetical protein